MLCWKALYPRRVAVITIPNITVLQWIIYIYICIYIYKCDLLPTIYTVWLPDIIFCRLLHIRSGKTRNLVSSLLCSLWWVQIFGYVLACRSYSFVCTVHHLIIIIVQTYLISQISLRYIYVVEYVSKIKHIFFPVSIIQYVGLYIFSLLISRVMIERIYILCLIIIIKSEVWIITHCLGLGHETLGYRVYVFLYSLTCRLSWTFFFHSQVSLFVSIQAMHDRQSDGFILMYESFH